MTHWPAIICFHGDAELAYVPDQTAWDQNPHLHGQNFHPKDSLIDAQGNCFALNGSADKVHLQPTGTSLGLDEVLQLVRRHAAQDGACCVAKLSAASIAEAIALVG